MQIQVSLSVNKSNTHFQRCHSAHTLTHCSPVTCRLSSRPKPALGLPVFLRVSVKCIHMLLRELRLERDCFRSDKNHLAPSKEPASESLGQHRTVEHIAARPWHHDRVHRLPRTGSSCITVCYLTARFIAFILCFHKEGR